MAKHHQSFLIRCWQLDRGEKRIEIEHIQSGDRWLAHSTSEAIDWIHARLGQSPAAMNAPDERSGGKTGDID